MKYEPKIHIQLWNYKLFAKSKFDHIIMSYIEQCMRCNYS